MTNTLPSPPKSKTALPADLQLPPREPSPSLGANLFQWFNDRPIGQKQVLAIIACELIPILGLGIGSTIVLTNSLRTQLLSQATSELAVTETNYNIKINQMGFGSRGQADNVSVINAAKLRSRGETVNAGLQSYIKTILQNEVRARKIEYATLVGRDLKIITNANNDRTGDTFDPNQLVSEALKTNQQIKASAIVAQQEINRESPPLPENYDRELPQALIRYVVTPVKDPATQAPIGALVFGDVVNYKPTIVENTINAFGGGYSGVYLQAAPQQFRIGSTFDGIQRDLGIPQAGLDLLNQAVQQKGKAVTGRMEINGKTYTVAAKALPTRIVETPNGSEPSYTPEAPALIVRGTPEDSVNQLLQRSLLQEGVVLGVSFLFIVGFSLLFRRTVVKAIRQLEQTAQAFAQGDRTARAKVLSSDEIGQLTVQFNRMADTIAASEMALSEEASRQEQQAREAKMLNDAIAKMRSSLSFDSITQTAVEEIRQLLKVDRVLMYDFTDSGFRGKAIAESVVSGVPQAVGLEIDDLLGLSKTEQPKEQSFWFMNDVNQADLTDRHRDYLERLQVKANLVAPIRHNNQLIGLLCAHQCQRPRYWQGSEINLFVQFANQIGYALDQAQLLKNQQQSRLSAETLKDQLQQQIVHLLNDVEGVAQGDLTVRADVMAGDLGTLGDFFNVIVESLRDLVVKVKSSTLTVNDLLSDNEAAMQNLALESRQQVSEIQHLLSLIQHMTTTIETIAENANQSTIVAQNATKTAMTHEQSMAVTVEKIDQLRGTIEDTAQKVQQLGMSSQQISRIVALIKEFAVQTDLLAVNAGLEASRAGAQGRGFAIIASEVAGLAARSAEATREIEQITETIQLETKAVVEAMNQGSQQVAAGSHDVRNAKLGLASLVKVSQQISQWVESISQTTVSQVETSRSVEALMQTTAKLTETTAASSEQVVVALQKTVATAQDLKDSVEMFKVE
ncbi:methyl-accepting chemotaxis protein [Alkalinema sp. FACHB-956]|uniref:methyl-accepting chemotaxis protein n=1 Tax=Alkalinema sp. FACHB-956 TaxID=2692768 RepID=UPI001686DEE1|nr:methyl-accepting chemotaxis protein [Alkalinema sp. FACHB-956]MBD2328161.1 GAF domain-containing protein [Alkalinema sp. FACHB-956]